MESSGWEESEALEEELVERLGVGCLEESQMRRSCVHCNGSMQRTGMGRSPRASSR